MIDKLFVYLISAAGHWIGVTSRDEFDTWLTGNALILHDGRMLHFASDPRSQMISVTIGPLYIGDTAQEHIAVFPTSAEVIGQVSLDEKNNESCDENNGLFVQYTEAITKWRAAQSNIQLATPADLSNISANISNITNLRRDK